jgi:AcrR family transcriptional regulator
MSDRLNKSEWIEHGLRTLAKDGANALKVGPMSAKLKVSRGSFYWHFRDLADFRSQILRHWQERVTDHVIQELEARKGEPDRLRYLMALGPPHRLERAVRAWATQDKEVAKVVASDDARRVAYIASLLVAAGVESQQALDRAIFLYWAFLGQAAVMNPRHSSIAASTLGNISKLFMFRN